VQLGIFTMPHIDSQISDVFVDSGRLKFIDHKFHNETVEKKHIEQVNWIINRSSKKKGFKTIFYLFHHPGVVYGKSIINTTHATRRMTCARKDPKTGIPSLEFDIRMRECQMSALNLGAHTHRRFRGLLWKQIDEYKEVFINQTKHIDGEILDEVYKYANMPNPKKQQRIDAIKKLISLCLFNKICWMDVIKGSMKPDEWAKPGKYPRLIGDYSVLGSLLASFLVQFMKEMFHSSTEEYEYHFVGSPKPENLDQIFTQLCTSNKRFYCIFFSDDAVIKIDGKYYNSDISSCDTSHTDGIFNFFLKCFEGSRFYDIIQRATLQCLKNIKILNPHYAKESVSAKNTMLTEYSGSQFTTIWNNIANVVIFLSIVYSHRNKPSSKDSIIECVQSIGYVITLEECICLEDIQFLKQSPYCVDGQIKAMMNIGVFLRSLGHCDGLLKKKRNETYEKAAENYVANVVMGFSGVRRNCITDVLSSKFIPKFKRKIRVASLKFGHDCSNIVDEYIPTRAICNRYDCSESEIIELCTTIEASQIGDVISLPVIRKIYAKDYGFPMVKTFGSQAQDTLKVRSFPPSVYK
jgi:hypothetical protein